MRRHQQADAFGAVDVHDPPAVPVGRGVVGGSCEREQLRVLARRGADRDGCLVRVRVRVGVRARVKVRVKCRVRVKVRGWG